MTSSLPKGLALDVEVSEKFGGDKTVEEARVVVAGLSWESGGLLSGGSQVQTPARSTLRVFK